MHIWSTVGTPVPSYVSQLAEIGIPLISPLQARFCHGLFMVLHMRELILTRHRSGWPD